MPITFSVGLGVGRSTSTAAKREILSIVEAVQGTEEFRTGINLAASASDVAITFGGLSKIKALIVNAKTEGGVDNKNLLLKITNTTRTGVTAGPHEIPFGSQVVLLDTDIVSATITNLSTTATDIEIIALGE